MNTVELFEKACDVARQSGYGIRHEYLGGQGGGVGEFGGRKWIFVDLALSTVEQLEAMVDALREQHLMLADESLIECCERLEQQTARELRRVA